MNSFLFFFVFTLIIASKSDVKADLDELNTPEVPTLPAGHNPIDKTKCYKMTANEGTYGTFYIDPANKHVYGGLDLEKALVGIELPPIPQDLLNFTNMFAVLSVDVDFINDETENVTKINVTGIRDDTYVQFTGRNIMLDFLSEYVPGLAVLNAPLTFPTVMASVDLIIDGIHKKNPQTFPADFKFDMSNITALFPRINQMLNGLYLDSNSKPGFVVVVSPTVVVVGSGDRVDCKDKKVLPYGTATVPITGLNFVFVNDPLPGVYSFNPKTGLEGELNIVVASSDYTDDLPELIRKGSFSFRLQFRISLHNDNSTSVIDYSKVVTTDRLEYVFWANDAEAVKAMEVAGRKVEINQEIRMGDFTQLEFLPLHNKILDLAKAEFVRVGVKTTKTIPGEKGSYLLVDDKLHEALYQKDRASTKELEPGYVPPTPTTTKPDDARYTHLFLTLCITVIMCFIF